MAYTSGTATNYLNLLSILATFAAANGWTILEQSSRLLYLRGEGDDQTDEIYVGIEAFENTASGYYNWSLVGSWGWRSGRAIDKHPFSSGKRYSYLWNASIPYWMVASPRRLVVIAKVSTVYQIIYLGFGQPPATASQYPYPLIVGGCGAAAAQAYSATGVGNSAFWANNGVGGMISTPGGDWRQVGPADLAQERCQSLSVGYDQKNNILTGIGGVYTLDQIYIADSLRVGIYAAIDGLYRVSGHGNSAENIISVGGVNHLVVPDVYRSGYGDYCALRLS